MSCPLEAVQASYQHLSKKRVCRHEPGTGGVRLGELKKERERERDIERKREREREREREGEGGISVL